MGESNTLLYVIAAFVILHFIAGIVYLVYKIGTAQPVISDANPGIGQGLQQCHAEEDVPSEKER